MRNRIPCQRDAGTRLVTALRRRPFSACNKGNRRRLHAGNGELAEKQKFMREQIFLGYKEAEKKNFLKAAIFLGQIF